MSRLPRPLPFLPCAFALCLLLPLLGADPALSAGDGYQGQAFACQSGDCANGQGLAVWPDGARYEGGFVNGQRQGKGAMSWPGGDRYSGDWQAGFRQGHGTMTWAAGTRYIGQWVRGARSGKGIMIYTSGKRVDGIFEADRLVETVRVIEPKAATVAESTPKPPAKDSGKDSGNETGSGEAQGSADVPSSSSTPTPTPTTPPTPTATPGPTPSPAPTASQGNVPVLQPAPSGPATTTSTAQTGSGQDGAPVLQPAPTQSTSQSTSQPASQPGAAQPTLQPAPTQPVSVPAGDKAPKAQAAALLVEVSYQGRVQFVNLYLGGSLAELRQKAQAAKLPQGFSSREALQYQGPPAWVAQYATYAENPGQAFCYGAALGCADRDQCETQARQAWSQAGCLGLNSSEGYSAFDNGYSQELHPDTFPEVRFFR